MASGPPSEPPKCRYRLDNDSSDTFTLPDGRKLGYAQYGSLTGRPVLYLHGLPGSRIEAAHFHDMGLELGARIIATDRPGYGWSSPHPGRKLLDFPKDLEHLANHLKLDEYGVVGVSGGGPYVLACAKAMPREKLKCAAIMCGLGPPDLGMGGAQGPSRFLFLGYRYAPWATRWFFQRDPITHLDLPDEKRLELLLQNGAKSITNEKDRAFFQDEDSMRLYVRSSRESYAHGFDALLQDGKIMSTDYGFRVEDIRTDLPVRLWYGNEDVVVPLNHGKQIAARLGDKALLRVEAETHGSIFINKKREMLEDLLKNM